MKRFKEYVIIASIGGLYYFLLEILWRGYSHWIMILVGGISAALIYLVDEKLGRISLISKCIIGALAITIAELLSGIIVNIWLQLDIWDYSKLQYNFLGQISIKTSFLWFLLCVPAFILSGIVREIFKIKGENYGEKVKKAKI